MAGRVVAIIRIIPVRGKYRIVHETIGPNGQVRRRTTLKDKIATEAVAEAKAEKLRLLA